MAATLSNLIVKGCVISFEGTASSTFKCNSQDLI